MLGWEPIMTEIKTLVYFDLEATGLKSSGKPRISEITLVAINTQDVFDLNLIILEHLKKSNIEENMFEIESLLPRVLNKLTLCVYPMATIMPQVSCITGLDNYNLAGQARFEKSTVDLLNIFLDRLPSPVCLVAHNGNLYDFPLLKAELEKAGGKLGSEIFCVDSYVGIKEIFQNLEAKKTEDARKQQIERLVEKEIVEKEIEAVKNLLAAGEFDRELEMDASRSNKVREALDNLNPRSSKTISVIVANSSQNQEKSREHLYSESFKSLEKFEISKLSKHECEQTPTGTKTPLSRNLKARNIKQLYCSALFKSKKKLNFSVPGPPSSFSLVNLHKHMLGCPPTKSHGAEADCLALLRITAVLGKEWLEWVKYNCHLFTECRKMWGI